MIVVKKCYEIEMKTISGNCMLEELFLQEMVGLKAKIEKDTPEIGNFIKHKTSYIIMEMFLLLSQRQYLIINLT